VEELPKLSFVTKAVSVVMSVHCNKILGATLLENWFNVLISMVAELWWDKAASVKLQTIWHSPTLQYW